MHHFLFNHRFLPVNSKLCDPPILNLNEVRISKETSAKLKADTHAAWYNNHISRLVSVFFAVLHRGHSGKFLKHRREIGVVIDADADSDIAYCGVGMQQAFGLLLIRTCVI